MVSHDRALEEGGAQAKMALRAEVLHIEVTLEVSPLLNHELARVVRLLKQRPIRSKLYRHIVLGVHLIQSHGRIKIKAAANTCPVLNCDGFIRRQTPHH